MTKDRNEVLENDDNIEIVKKSEEKLEAFIEDEAAPVTEQTTKRKSNASVSVDKFDWDAFEKEKVYDTDKSVIEDLYSQTLSKVIEMRL